MCVAELSSNQPGPADVPQLENKIIILVVSCGREAPLHISENTWHGILLLDHGLEPAMMVPNELTAVRVPLLSVLVRINTNNTICECWENSI